jgi:hypothetical protein
MILLLGTALAFIVVNFIIGAENIKRSIGHRLES